MSDLEGNFCDVANWSDNLAAHKCYNLHNNGEQVQSVLKIQGLLLYSLMFQQCWTATFLTTILVQSLLEFRTSCNY